MSGLEWIWAIIARIVDGWESKGLFLFCLVQWVLWGCSLCVRHISQQSCPCARWKGLTAGNLNRKYCSSNWAGVWCQLESEALISWWRFWTNGRQDWINACMDWGTHSGAVREGWGLRTRAWGGVIQSSMTESSTRVGRKNVGLRAILGVDSSYHHRKCHLEKFPRDSDCKGETRDEKQDRV